MKPWNLLEASYGQIKGHQYDVAVLPLGATEPHNLHLPYGTDVLEATIVGEHICKYAHDKGANVVLLPTIPYGTETNLREFPLAMNLNPSTLNAVMSDLIDSLVKSGIHKIVLLNSHGGNGIKPFLREQYGRTPAHLFLCNWYDSIRDIYFDIFERPEDHAGEMETSFGMAYFPDLIDMQDAGGEATNFNADAGATTPLRFQALQEGWVSITRPWHLLTSNAGSGDPHQATAEKGQKLMGVLEERLGQFLVDLSASPIDETFPFGERSK